MHVDTHFVVPFRLRQTQLQQGYPIWAAADVAPKNGGSWKEVVVVATKLEAPAAPNTSFDLHKRFECLVAEYKRQWNPGSARIQLNLCLSRHAHAANQRFQAYGNEVMPVS
ncbi:TPA: hypothetical protein ACH3X1_015230 [Trebouxia sp. C0004]